MKHEVHFAIDTTSLPHYTDTHLAALWHIGQANPAPIEDQGAGELAEDIGREIIRRFVSAIAPELYNRQGAHFFSMALARIKSQSQAMGKNPRYGFVTMPDSTLPCGRFVPAFEYAKYPSAKGSEGHAVLSVSSKPWVNVSYHAAVAACALDGHQLARESQELAIRHDVAQQAINWTSGIVGEGKLFQGLHKGSVRSAQAADYVSEDAEERSWHQLSTGERVYGLAGNIWTWVHDDVQGTDTGLTSTIAAGSPSLSAPYPSRIRGMGYRPDGERDWSGYALIRGGYWHDGDYAGVFLLVGAFPDDDLDHVGFRCTKPIGL